ncbi:MAG TPA: hypothetical protein VFT12_07625 [Thermoanaerobaculia bacterium]|nr:hypothetical protein [Thermoanaerobaculia bacterium]
MKGLVVVLTCMALFMGCASSSLPVNAIEGGPGQDISVALAGIEESDLPLDSGGSRNYLVQLEVSNNSNRPITVTRIGVAPPESSRAFQLSASSATFNEMIDPGEDHIFDVRMQGVLVRNFRPEESRRVEFRVLVGLSNEETYFYTFEAPVRDDLPRRF